MRARAAPSGAILQGRDGCSRARGGGTGTEAPLRLAARAFSGRFSIPAQGLGFNVRPNLNQASKHTSLLPRHTLEAARVSKGAGFRVQGLGFRA